MYTTTSEYLSITINSINDTIPAIVMQHNKLIAEIRLMTSAIARVMVRNGFGLVRVYNNIRSQDLQIDISNLVDWTINNSLQMIKFTITVKLGAVPRVFEREIRLRVIQGKSYPLRENVNTTHNLLQDDRYLEVFSPFAGSINGTIPILEGINLVDTQQVGDSFIISEDFDINTFDNTFDHTFNGDSDVVYHVNINRVCPVNDQYCVIRYKNYLGEGSMLLGYIMTDSYIFDGSNFNSSDISVYNRDKKFNLASTEQELTVAIPNAHYNLYPSDILLNDIVEIQVGDRTFKCAPKADSINRSSIIQDYQIKLSII